MFKKAGYILTAIAAVFVIWILFRTEATPSVSKGISVVREDQSYYARTSTVLNVDATDRYIYLNHGRSGVISAFDWDGNYCFTIVTNESANSADPSLFCIGDTLYIIDKSNHYFKYLGKQMLEHYQIESYVEAAEIKKELAEAQNHLVHLEGKNVVDEAGNVIMKVCDTEETKGRRELILIIPTIILMVAMAVYMAKINSKKRIDSFE